MPDIGLVLPASDPVSGQLRSNFRRLLRISSVRLLLLYTALFILSVTVLFSAVSLIVTRTTMRQLDGDVREELQEIMADAGSTAVPDLRRVMQAKSSEPDDRMHYLLLNAAGQRIFGDLPVMNDRSGPFTLQVEGLRWSVRGRGIALPDGYMFVGEDEIQLPRLRRALCESFLFTIGLTLLLSLAGGVVMSKGVLRRIDTISRTSRAIMAGDMSRRIPLTGSEDEFDQLARVLNLMLARIEALMEGVRQTSSGIAHDLRTPLTRMRQRLEIATLAQAPEALREALHRSIGDIDTVLGTFSALLRIGQIESGSRRSGFARVDLVALAGSLAEAYTPLAEEQGHALSFQNNEPVFVVGDAALLTQALANLIENAIQHCRFPTRIDIRVDQSPRHVSLIVADHGLGIPPAQLATALRRFSRLAETNETAGAGVGLAMVAAIVALHEAELTLDDNAPGLRVVIRFVRPHGR
ncbi:MAG: ATP-binding protein [Acidocella sp.]|nr:ATP-binding protein [Acidocella sp.]